MARRTTNPPDDGDQELADVIPLFADLDLQPNPSPDEEILPIRLKVEDGDVVLRLKRPPEMKAMMIHTQLNFRGEWTLSSLYSALFELCADGEERVTLYGWWNDVASLAPDLTPLYEVVERLLTEPIRPTKGDR